MKRVIGALVFCAHLCASFSQADCPLGDLNDVVVFCTDENDLGIKYPASTNTDMFCFFSEQYGDILDSVRSAASSREFNSFDVAINISNCLSSGCFSTPKWLLMQVEESGSLVLELNHTAYSDIDFACWGPFWGDKKSDVLQSICEDPVTALNFIPQYRVLTQEDIDKCPILADRSSAYVERDNMLTQVDNACYRGNFDQYPYMNLQDCSFSYQYTEICHIENAQKGGWYLFMVTNFGNLQGNIDIKRVGGSAVVSCKPIVDISNTGPYCEGDDIHLKLLNAPENATYSWLGPDGFSSTEKNPVIPNATVAQAGTYSLQIVANGISSAVVETDVVVYPFVSEDTTITLEYGDTYLYDGHVYSETGDHMEADSSNPCGVKNVHLVVSPPSITLTSNAPICEGTSLVLSAELFSDVQYDWILPSGQRVQNQSNVWTVDDADSSSSGIYQLDVIAHSDTFSYQIEAEVHKKHMVTQEVALLHGDSIEFNGTMLHEAGEYQNVFTDQYGCDSVVTLKLRYDLPAVHIISNSPLCEGESLELSMDKTLEDVTFLWTGPNGFSSNETSISIPDATVEQSGVYRLNITARSNDELNVETEIRVNKRYDTLIYDTIAYGMAYAFEGEDIYKSGVYEKKYTSIGGCDSVIELHLEHYLPSFTLSSNAPICEGEELVLSVEQESPVDDILWSGPNGFTSHEKTLRIPDVTAQNGGRYTLTIAYLPDVVSDTFIDVQVGELSSVMLYDTILFGKQYEFDGRSLNETGEYTVVSTAQSGCDSTTTLRLTVIADSSLSLSSGSFYCYGDSIVIRVDQPQENTEYSWTGPNHFVSTGASVRIDNATVENSGVYVVTKKQHGETFTKSVTIQVAPRSAYDTTITLEYGKSLDFFGTLIDKSGKYEMVLSNAMGCDSFVTMTVVCTLPVFHLQTNSPVCEGDELTIQIDGELGGASIEWVGPDGFSSTQNEVSIPNATRRNQGEYKLLCRYSDTLVEKNINAFVRERYSEEVEASIPKGETYVFDGEQLDESGDYTKTFVSYGGCDSVVTLHLSVIFPDTSLNILSGHPYCEGEAIHLRVDPQYDYAEYRWEGPQHFHLAGPEAEIENASKINAGVYQVVMTVFDKEIRRSVDVDVYSTYANDTNLTIPYGTTYDFYGTTLTQTGVYKTTFQSVDGCDSTITLNLTVMDFVPLVPAPYFSPDGDGVNDQWIIENAEKYDHVMVTIYNRYGAIVRRYDHYENEMGWDGKDEKGYCMPSADYWYTITYQGLVQKGNFTLIRH